MASAALLVVCANFSGDAEFVRVAYAGEKTGAGQDSATTVAQDTISPRVIVGGRVGTPGVCPMIGRTSLLQAIAMAGGIDVALTAGKIVLIRAVDGMYGVSKFEIAAVESGTAPDPELQAGDVVIVDARRNGSAASDAGPTAFEVAKATGRGKWQ